jgi:hypothetical protein
MFLLNATTTVCIIVWQNANERRMDFQAAVVKRIEARLSIIEDKENKH